MIPRESHYYTETQIPIGSGFHLMKREVTGLTLWDLYDPNDRYIVGQHDRRTAIWCAKGVMRYAGVSVDRLMEYVK